MILDDLIEIRKEKKIDQKGMVKHLGVNKTTISRYENGKRDMPLSIFMKYVEYLGYEIRLLKK